MTMDQWIWMMDVQDTNIVFPSVMGIAWNMDWNV